MEPYTLRTKASPQTVSERFTHDQLAAADAVGCLCLTEEGTLALGTDKGCLFLHRPFGEDRFCKISGADGRVSAMCAAPGGGFYAAVPGEILFVSAENRVDARLPFGENVLQLEKGPDGTVWLLTAGGLYTLTREGVKPDLSIDPARAVSMTAAPSGDVFVFTAGGVLRRFGKRPRWGNMTREMTRVPDAAFLSAASDALGMLWIGAKDGVYLFDGKSEWLTPADFAFMPRCPVNCVALGEGDTVYLGTDVGLYIISGEKTRFYGKGRWLPGERVLSVLPLPGEDAVWVGADAGAAKLSFVPMTLAQKENLLYAQIPYFKREGFVTKKENTKNGDPSTGEVSITDNDGLWSAVYAAAASLKYAVTGDEAAKADVRETVEAMLRLHTVTGIPGFPARAYRRPGEAGYGNGHPEWHAGRDEKGALEWKGETSSDELVGHFYALSWYYDLCADETERERIASALSAVTEHILTHGYTLCDADGLPTTWAHFGPEELNGDDNWCWEKGINSLELLTFLRITAHVTGEKKWEDRLYELAACSHYAMNIAVYKKYDAHSCHIDDRLGFYCITHLLRLETDPALLRFVKLGLRRHYEYERCEHSPYYDFVYAWATGSRGDSDEAVTTLEEYPLDPRVYPVKNSIRPDVPLDPDTAKYGEAPHALFALPAGERVTDCLCYNPFRLDEYKGDRHMVPPSSWLLAYWFGRWSKTL